MEEEESVEFKTVKVCDGALAKALKGAGLEIGMVNFLKEKGFITEGVRSKVIGMTTTLGDVDKTNLLVEGIKDRIDQDENSFQVLMDEFKRSGVMYEPIVNKLKNEHMRRSLATYSNKHVEPLSRPAMASGVGYPLASQSSTVASQGKISYCECCVLIYGPDNW